MEQTEKPAYSSTERPRSTSFWSQYNWTIIVLGASIISVILFLITGYTDIPQASNRSGGSTSLLPLILLSLGTVVLIRFLPPVFALANPLGKQEASKGMRLILGYALLYPFLLAIAQQFDYIYIGKIGLLFIPTCILFWFYGRKTRYYQPGTTKSTFWHWLGPISIAIVYLLVSSIPPFAIHGIQPAIPANTNIAVLLASQALITLLNAGLPEELFYRVLLQTRLEFFLGRWNGTALTSLLFALMHFPTRLISWLGITGTPLLGVVLALAAVIVFQGAGGFVLGYLWSRYRNIWINILFHTALDLVPVILIVVSLR